MAFEKGRKINRYLVVESLCPEGKRRKLLPNSFRKRFLFRSFFSHFALRTRERLKKERHSKGLNVIRHHKERKGQNKEGREAGRR